MTCSSAYRRQVQDQNKYYSSLASAAHGSLALRHVYTPEEVFGVFCLGLCGTMGDFPFSVLELASILHVSLEPLVHSSLPCHFHALCDKPSELHLTR